MLSPETIRLMAQTYEEWMQDPSALSRPLEKMRWAYQHICAGEDPWTGLGSFSHDWYGYAKGRRVALVSEPLVQPMQETEYTRRWGAFCAASVEFLCERYDIPCPDWPATHTIPCQPPGGTHNSPMTQPYETIS